jgi:RNA polymerase sigma factor (sigma-70 family)
MSDQEKFDPAASNGEDPLEALLDESSEEEFGLPEFRNHFSEDNTPVVLRDWTAKEFSSVYVRFKPHLERHARRYLNNQTQVEEVVQDAFLYLMTALPELDSELGVLRFLKWKTRLLALDVIRANSKVAVQSLENEDVVSLEPEVSKGLERADDAAIVSMALAKLNPRHREVLIASLYQEKATEDIASQLGLSDNATRQLIFRARSAFKKALVGEAETAGLRISEILSIAARKARSESLTIISSAGAIALLIGAFFTFNPLNQEPTLNADAVVTEAPTAAPTAVPTEVEAESQTTEPETSAPTENLEPAEAGTAAEESVQAEELVEQPVASAPAAQRPQSGNNQGSSEPVPAPAPTQPEPAEESYALEIGRASLASIELVEMGTSEPAATIEPVRIYMIDNEGRAISFYFDLGAEEIFSDVEVSIVVDGIRYSTLNLYNAKITADLETGRFVFESELGLLVDEERYLLENDAINDATVRIQLDTDEDLTRIKMYEVSYHSSFETRRI